MHKPQASVLHHYTINYVMSISKLFKLQSCDRFLAT